MSIKQTAGDIAALSEGGSQARATAKIIVSTFGLQMAKTSVYKAGIPSNDKTQDDYGFIPEVGKSSLGTFVFSNLELASQKYFDLSTGRQVNAPSMSIDTVLFTVENQKNIISTPIQGRPGTIKEYIADGDYRIQIRGVLTAPNGIYPKNNAQNLIDLLRAPQALDINSWFLSMFNIYQMVVSDFSFGQAEGGKSIQPFMINALSDTPFVFDESSIRSGGV